MLLNPIDCKCFPLQGLFLLIVYYVFIGILLLLTTYGMSQSGKRSNVLCLKMMLDLQLLQLHVMLMLLIELVVLTS